MDPRSSVRPGQPLALAAEQVNWINRQMSGDSGFRGGSSPGLAAPYTWVYAKNTSGEAAARWSVMKIESVAITPTSDDSSRPTVQFQEMPVLELSEAADGEPYACVALEPIAEDAVGRVAVAGVVQVRADQLDKLGGVQVLWEGDGWALVRLSGGAAIRLGRISADWTPGESATVEMLDETGAPFDPPSTFTAKNFCSAVYVQEAETVNVACGLLAGTWILIEAARGCGGAANAKELDYAADESSSVSFLSEGGGTQVLVNDQGCAKWYRLSQKTIVTDVAFVDGELVKTTEQLYVLQSTIAPDTSTIIGTVECPSPE